MSILDRLRKRSNPPSSGSNSAGPPASPSAGSHSPAPGMNTIQKGDLTLVTYSYEEILQRIEDGKSQVTFGLSKHAKTQYQYLALFAWLAPVCFALGTIGEIITIVLAHQKDNGVLAITSVILGSLISEGGLVYISWRLDRLRNEADRRTSGWTDVEKKDFKQLRNTWIGLALLMAGVQVFFLVSILDPGKGLGQSGIWSIAILRALTALLGDYITAFLHKEPPTDGEKALMVKEEEVKYTNKALEQEVAKINTLNAGMIQVHNAALDAQLRQEELKEKRELAKKEHEAQAKLIEIETENRIKVSELKSQNEIMALQNQMKQMQFFIQLQNDQMRLLYGGDGEMSETDQKRMIAMMRARGLDVVNVSEVDGMVADAVDKERRLLLDNLQQQQLLAQDAESNNHATTEEL